VKSTALRHRYQMKDGMEVVVRGKITVYPPQGKYQLTAEALYQTGRRAAGFGPAKAQGEAEEARLFRS